MKKELLVLALLAAPVDAESLLEARAREYNTPRKTEHFMRSRYQNFQDAQPQRLNTTEEFLSTGLGDEKEMVNAATDMMQRNGYAAKKMYYRTASGIERYYAYIADPPQQNNYIMHIQWNTEMIPHTIPQTIIDHHGNMRIYWITVYQPHTYIAPTLLTGFGNETDAKMYLQREPIVEWGQFEYDQSSPDGMKRMPG